jgi:pimeloyl-ACP methyl ester carboxylesterase
MMKTETYFLHGLDSSGNGTKGRFFAKHFPQVIRPDFSGTLESRLQQLEELCCNNRSLTFIGSSYGGLMATCYAIRQPDKINSLILLAPALNFENYQSPVLRLEIPTVLVVGKHDTVTPAELVVPLAKATFSDLEILIEDDDHLLHKSFSTFKWEELLSS